MKYQSRMELLKWYNQYHYLEKIEDVGKGRAPSFVIYNRDPTFPIGRISEDNFKNLSLIQEYFYNKKTSFNFPLEKLAKCKLQDTLELSQWLYNLYESDKHKSTSNIIISSPRKSFKCNSPLGTHNNELSIISCDNNPMLSENPTLSLSAVSNLDKCKLCKVTNEDIINLEDERDAYYLKLKAVEKYVLSGLVPTVKDILELIYD